MCVQELEAKEARLAAARKALEDARALPSSLSSQRDLSASASALTESKKKTMLSESDTNKPKDSDDDIRRKAEVRACSSPLVPCRSLR